PDLVLEHMKQDVDAEHHVEQGARPVPMQARALEVGSVVLRGPGDGGLAGVDARHPVPAAAQTVGEVTPTATGIQDSESPLAPCMAPDQLDDAAEPKGVELVILLGRETAITTRLPRVERGVPFLPEADGILETASHDVVTSAVCL